MSSLLEYNTSITSATEDLLVSDEFSFFENVNEQALLRPVLLTDKSRLPEIYNLRLNVWEHSGKNEFVNRNLYPNGWYDDLDESAFHWIVINNENKIIASARLNLFATLEEFPYYLSVQNLSLPVIMPFAFFSRLVVHPLYRQNGLSRQLFTDRTLFCKEKKIRWIQVFINNPGIIRQYERSGYQNIGQAGVSYHPSAEPHLVNVFIKENK